MYNYRVFVSSFPHTKQPHTNAHTHVCVQIHNTVNPYIQALGHGMPQKCKLPLYDYGSKGIVATHHTHTHTHTRTRTHTHTHTHARTHTHTHTHTHAYQSSHIPVLYIPIVLFQTTANPTQPVCLHTVPATWFLNLSHFLSSPSLTVTTHSTSSPSCYTSSHLSLSCSRYFPFVLYSGVLGFYYAQLTPVIQYGELRTEVFQVFKEIGNTVLFCLLLEKSMVSASNTKTGGRLHA